ncbi:hydroxymethylpyrimidine/phosphomethylpyrimidine kinase [Phaeobacter sp. PT47_59]|uniref:bifunctional hydroxymethylpyrimidine kinase/phosphomethylpyrimidine kinase n=1 Tax=Phaeobacter sp. PT47_59 TaxID=3029979 RepID=UPI00237FD8BE|nr:hydroxymethylpyrimidine/phosphomethylpyrimidine kinase [Phaeobacter sp. PT47_59]MDE4176146.1 hydroxymethylpyrimidine/phosphomethylpyrimidine kinase [Phaeobacter sp. PT47_59]
MTAAPRILVIAGTDSSGGAGLTRDTATAAELGCRVAPVVTAVTAQTSATLRCALPLPTPIIVEQMRASLDEAPVDAVKIGMLGTAEAALAIAAHLPPRVPVVLDPVLKSSSGGDLGHRQSLAPLWGRVSLLTPNLTESAALAQQPVSEDPDDLQRQAISLLGNASQPGPAAVLIKGGHGSRQECLDYLFRPGTVDVLRAPRQRQGARGTGCSLATAIACFLARGLPLATACEEGKHWLTQWLTIQEISARPS